MIHLHFATALFGALLLAAALIDARTMRIPDGLNALIAAAGLGAAWALERPVADALIGMAAGYLALWATNRAYRAWRGRDGLGMGDAKLLGAGGAWIGWMGLAFAVLIAALAGLAFIAFEAARGRKLGGQTALAFGPFLCLGLFAVWLALHWAQF